MQDFYKQTTWRKKRDKILRRDEYRCQECKRYGRTKQASHVHHIIPLEWCLVFDKLLALANVNLISLCKECHDKMHDRSNDKLTELGKKLVIRFLGNYGKEWIDKYGGKSS